MAQYKRKRKQNAWVQNTSLYITNTRPTDHKNNTETNIRLRALTAEGYLLTPYYILFYLLFYM